MQRQYLSYTVKLVTDIFKAYARLEKAGIVIETEPYRVPDRGATVRLPGLRLAAIGVTRRKLTS